MATQPSPPSNSPWFAIPKPLAAFFSHFPLYTYPRIPLPANSYRPVTIPTLWLSPPLAYSPASVAASTATSVQGQTVNAPASPTAEAYNDLLSSDVECLKWQAYIALRGLSSIRVRFDISPEGAIEGRLPNLHVPLSEGVLPRAAHPSDRAKTDVRTQQEEVVADGELLAAHMIPTWVDAKLGVDSADDINEGYVDEAAKDESRAWVSLLEGAVHAALILAQPKHSYLHSLLFSSSPRTTSAIAPTPNEQPHPLASLLTPPPAPLTGYFSLFPPWGTHISPSAILSQYREAVAALSDRLGTDKWFLGSAEPTPLDALAFAYLHCILHSPDVIRIEVTKHVNLVAWEWRVRGMVRAAFIP